jgi:chaperonin GroES
MSLLKVEETPGTEKLVSEDVSEKKWWVPMGNCVLVRPAVQEEQTKSGIWLPPQSQERQTHGIVLGVGPGKHEYGFWVDTTLKVGDNIIYSKHSGQDMKIDGESVVMIRESDVLARMLTMKSEPIGVEDIGKIDQEELAKIEGTREPVE